MTDDNRSTSQADRSITSAYLPDVPGSPMRECIPEELRGRLYDQWLASPAGVAHMLTLRSEPALTDQTLTSTGGDPRPVSLESEGRAGGGPTGKERGR